MAVPQEVVNPQTYRSVFLIAPDAYEGLGGTFQSEFEHKVKSEGEQAGRNLIVFPKSFIFDLEAAQQRYMSEGAIDAMNLLRSLNSREIRHTAEGLGLYRVSDNLDILQVDDRQINPSTRTPAQKLEQIVDDKRVKDLVSHPKFEIASDDVAIHLHLSGKGFAVNEVSSLKVDRNIVHKGVVDGSDTLLAAFMEAKDQTVPVDQVMDLLKTDLLYPNQFVKFSASNSSSPIFASIDGVTGTAKLHQPKGLGDLSLNSFRYKRGVLGIVPRYLDQYMALQHALLDPEKKIIFIAGSAGTGKTLLAYAAGLDLALPYADSGHINNRFSRQDKESKEVSDRHYRSLVLIKSMWDQFKLGFVPGDVKDKLAGNLGSFADAHNLTSVGQQIPFSFLQEDPRQYSIMSGVAKEKGTASVQTPYISRFKGLGFQYPASEPLIDLFDLSQIRGRSLSNRFVIIDEAQNFQPFDMKTFLSRASDNCKYVVLGDLDQFDNYPICTPTRNGFTAAIATYLDSPIAALINLGVTQRDEIARIANTMRISYKNPLMQRGKR